MKLVILLFLISFGFHSSASERNSYSSDADQLLTIRRIGILPVSDNVNNLYSRPVEIKLKELVSAAHRFEYVEIKNADPLFLPSDYESKASQILEIGSKFKVEGLIVAHINKMPQGVELVLDLFLSRDGLLLAQEISNLPNSFNTKSIEQAAQDMYFKLIKKIPYDGLILSRQGNRVTVDIGSRDGIAKNTIINVEQVISFSRHPKYHFILGVERVTLGKVRLVKVDETLSFGIIIAEKDSGVISVGNKISGLDFVNYTKDTVTGEDHPDSGAAKFSKNSTDLIPLQQPSFGKVGIGVGFGTFKTALSFQNTGSYEGHSSFYPQLQLTGEIWVTKSWFVGTEIRQGTTSSISSAAGGVTGGVRTTDYDLYVGYKFLLQDDFWGPQVNFHLGFASSAMVVDSASATSLSSTTYSGLYYGIGGSVPVAHDRTIYLDLDLNRYFSPQFSETPFNSGAANDSSAMMIAAGGSFKFSPHLWAVAHLVYEFYSTTFVGVGARSAGSFNDTGLNSSESLTSLIGGVNYYF